MIAILSYAILVLLVVVWPVVEVISDTVRWRKRK